MSLSFLAQAARQFNAGQTRAQILSGNVHDLFPHEDNYLPLPQVLAASWDLPGRLVVTYEINGPLRFRNNHDRQCLKDAWLRWHTGMDAGDLALQKLIKGSRNDDALAGPANAQQFDTHLNKAVGRPTLALELIRQFCCCSRAEKAKLDRDLVIIIEGADLILPEAPITSLGDADRQRLHICHDWFSDPSFLEGNDVVVLLAESRASVNQRIARLPQVLGVDVPQADLDTRKHYIDWYQGQHHDSSDDLPDGSSPVPQTSSDNSSDELARQTAGLSLQSLRQLLAGAEHAGRPISRDDIINKVEEHIRTQLGEDVVSFSKPSHRLDDLVGNTRLKTFLREELIPRFKLDAKGAIPGAVVGGPIGAGKTFIFEAVAAELDLPVLELKSIRSQWFGQTDVILERLRRVLVSLDKVVIFVDEADTQFGSLNANAHSTERRLTGKIQAMMSDPRLLGRVYWLLMTARIHLLSPDIRRPGRVGDLIIPVLDSEPGEDRDAFMKWSIAPVLPTPSDEFIAEMNRATPGFSAASYASLRRELQARFQLDDAAADPEQGVRDIVTDLLPPPLARTRRYQTLQALVNCSRRRLLPDPEAGEEERHGWEQEIAALEAEGMS